MFRYCIRKHSAFTHDVIPIARHVTNEKSDLPIYVNKVGPSVSWNVTNRATNTTTIIT